EGGQPPQGGEGGQPPQDGEGGQPPQGGEGGQPPQDGEGGQPPQGGEGGQPPQGGEGGQPPQDGEGGQPPQGGEGGQPPQGGEGGQPPQDGEGGQPPQGGEGGQPPQGGEGGQPPQDGEGGQPPQGGEGGQPPQGGEGGQPPQGGEGGQPPQGGEGGQPPQGGEGGQPPQGGEGGQPPQGSEGGQPPQGDQGQGGPGMGKKLTFSPHQRPHGKPQSPRMKMPKMPDFAKGLDGKVEGDTVLGGLNKGLEQAGFGDFAFKQRDDGVLNVEGGGVKFGFAPDVNEMTQAGPDVPTGLSQDKKGRYVMTTPEGYQFSMNPAPHNPDGLMEALGENGSCEIGEHGDTRIDIGNDAYSGVFNPFVQGRGPMEKKHGPLHPGLNMKGGIGVMVYPDGSVQEMLPTMQSPDTFLGVAEKFPGVEQVTPNVMDGTIMVVFMGAKLKLKPGFNIMPPPEPREGIEPNITLDEEHGNQLKFEDEFGNVQTMSYEPDV
ncbi:hypothetical protein QUF74_04085, partial [Candidatus Halobeggiatoa sp. HSG11]|nr:hypothetical protein [Candidatus Halobeggiatoa sp. HSG11]